jgi:hypothetical protein
MGELNIFNLDFFKTDFGCTTYVETGTGIGVCLRHMINYDFQQYYSIDLDGDLIEQAKINFPQDNINFIHDYSTQALEKLVPTLPIDTPVLFFLDAHFPGADFGKMSYTESITEFKQTAFPLIQEINIIQKHRDISKDCFIIDDWKLYDSTLNYEMPGWEYEQLQKQLNIVTDGNQIINLFKDTHDHEVKLRHQGFLFLTPKFI